LRRLLIALAALGLVAALASETSSAASVFPSHAVQAEFNF
jgi:hypothetical protein